MKLTELDIKQALLHPEQVVRDVALQYFTLSFSRDRSIMPMVVQTLEKYGWEKAFHNVWMAQKLAQTDETLLWLVGQLDEPSRLPTYTPERICTVICHTDAEVLGRHIFRLTGCQGLDDASQKAIGEYNGTRRVVLWDDGS